MITLDELREKCREFEEREGRASFYDLASEIKNIYPLHASVIILATWNMGRFRFMVNDTQNIVVLENALNKCKPFFDELKDKEFKVADFNELKDKIKKVYSVLSKIEGVKYTGASKIFHLFCPKLIVMWDSYIRKEYRKKKYKKEYDIRIKGETAEDFLNFQKLMQKIFGHINWKEEKKTLPKAIDEYNYMTYTVPKLRRKQKPQERKVKSYSHI